MPTLSGNFPSPIVNGAVQFVVLQEPPRADKYRSLPVICVVDINYSQDPKNFWNKWNPYLPSSTNLKIPTIQDFGLGRSIRNPLDLTLAAYGRDQTAWEQPARGNEPSSTIPAYASRRALLNCLQFKAKFGVLMRFDYILIATNLLPFIANLSWSKCIKQNGNPCGALEQLWYPVWHLDALFGQACPIR